MDAERTIHIRVGIFITTGLILAMIAVFMIGKERSWFEKRYQLFCTFSDISGLGKGASVSLAGMRVGSVKGVHFPSDLTRRDVIVSLEINKDFRDRIREDSRASIVTQGLLGDKMISITVGMPDSEPLGDGDVLQTEPSGDIYGIGRSATDLVSEVRRVVQSIDDMVTEAKQGKGLVHALLYDDQGSALIQDLHGGIRSFRLFTDRINASGDWRTVVANLEQASADLQNVTGQIRRGEGTLGALLTDDAIYNDIRAIFGRARRNVLLKSMVRSMIRANEMDLGNRSDKKQD